MVWNGFTAGNISFRITDIPVDLNVTTAQLFKGTRLVATVEVSADGRAFIPTRGLLAGSDYSLVVSREFVSGVFKSKPTSPFTISARSPLAYTYQALVRAGEGA